MDNKARTYFDMRIVVGLVVVAAGVVLLLESLDFGIDVHIWDYWPILVILVGLGKIMKPKAFRQVFWGVVLIGIGALFQLNNLGIIEFWFDDLWPILIILIGFVIIRGSHFKPIIFCFSDKNHHRWKHDSWGGIFSDKKQSVHNGHINISAILGSGEYNISSKQFKGGSVTAIMGGCELDFSNAEIAGDDEKVVIDASVIMGAIEMRIPTDWKVVLQGTPILGAVENKTASPEDSGKKVIIRGSVIMGAIEIKN
jgi:predicted membrane protein